MYLPIFFCSYCMAGGPYGHYWLTLNTFSFLAPWSTVNLKDPTVAQLFMKFPTFYGMQGFIIIFMKANHQSLSYAR
jgi:hypothetical protein